MAAEDLQNNTNVKTNIKQTAIMNEGSSHKICELLYEM